MILESPRTVIVNKVSSTHRYLTAQSPEGSPILRSASDKRPHPHHHSTLHSTSPPFTLSNIHFHFHKSMPFDFGRILLPAHPFIKPVRQWGPDTSFMAVIEQIGVE